MMTVEYRREMNRNYMVVRAERGRGGRYAEKMLTENRIPGLLSFYGKQVDDQAWFYYDITSRQPLGRILENRALTGPEIRRVVSDLLYTLKQMERFLMDEGQLNLNPEYIYVDPDTFQSFLCLIPGEYKSFSEEFCNFSKYLLDHVNHTDTEAVVLAFGIFQESRKSNFGMGNIERIIKQDLKASGKDTVCSEEDRTFDKKGISDRSERVHGNDTAGLDFGDELPVFGELKACGKPGASGVEKNSEADKVVAGLGRRALTGLTVLIMLLLPVGVALLQGTSALLRYKWILAGMEGCLLVLFMTFRKVRAIGEGNETETLKEAGIRIKSEERKGERKEKSNLEDGQEMFYKEEEDWEKILRGVDEPKDTEDGEFRTVLLTSGVVSEESHCLIPLAGGERISIPYFPFIIGKSRDLSDFCLDAPGVSRLHLRIDEKENGYTVTDLNSTNGTQVDQKVLQANESCSLTEGGIVKIAGLAYRFL